MIFLLFSVLCSLLRINNCSITIKSTFGVDLLIGNNYDIISGDVLVKENIYFLIIKEQNKLSLRLKNASIGASAKLLEVLSYPVTSAQSVAIDWISKNLYWADRENRFIEVVKLHDILRLGKKLGRSKRRILIGQEIANIDSIVVDPAEGYMFWLQVGRDVVVERAEMDGSKRRVLYRSNQYKSRNLAIDRHRKMLYWFERRGQIRRVDYQGRTGCDIQLIGEWDGWRPSFLTTSRDHLLFLNKGQVWSVEDPSCEALNQAIPADIPQQHKENKKPESDHIIAIVSRIPQLVPHVTSACSKNKITSKCPYICLSIPSSSIHVNCLCPTGNTKIRGACKEMSSSLVFASPPRLLRVPLDTTSPATSTITQPEPLVEYAGLPMQLASDPQTGSVFYIDYNSSASYTIKQVYITSDLYHPPKLYSIQPIFNLSSSFRNIKPIAIAIDSPARNIYWINIRPISGVTEVWVARIDMETAQLLYPSIVLVSRSSKLQLNNKFQSNFVNLALSRRLANIAVDSTNQYLFLTSAKSSSHGYVSIDRYKLDGTDRFCVVRSPKIRHPRGLALDPVMKRLFFLEVSSNSLMSIGYNGEDQKIVATDQISDAYGLTFIDGALYWTDMETMTIHRVGTRNKYNSDVGTRVTTIARIYNLQAATLPITSVLVPKHSNPYGYNVSPCGKSLNRNKNYSYNQCSQLCFPDRTRQFGYQCACSSYGNAMLLGTSLFSCPDFLFPSSQNKQSRLKRQSGPSFLFYNSSGIYVHKLDVITNSLSDGSILVKSSGITDIQVDMARSSVYWIDSINNCVRQKSLTSDYVQKKDGEKKQNKDYIITCADYKNGPRQDSSEIGGNRITKISVDWVHNNLYVLLTNLRLFTSQLVIHRLPFPYWPGLPIWNRMIMMESPDSSSESKQLLSNAQVHPMSRTLLLLFTDSSSSSTGRENLLQACELDGGNCENIWKGSAKSDSLAVDHYSDYVYWARKDCNGIFQFNIHTKVIHSLRFDWSIDCSKLGAPLFYFYPAHDRLYLYMGSLIFVLNKTAALLTTSISVSRSSLVPIQYSHTTVRTNTNDVFGMVISNTNISVEQHQKDYLYSVDVATVARVTSKIEGAILCPSKVICEQICLPTSHSNCSCSSLYSGLENKDGVYSCYEKHGQILSVTRYGEVIGLNPLLKSRAVGLERQWWIDSNTRNGHDGAFVSSEETVIDAVLWRRLGALITVDVDGYLRWRLLGNSASGGILKRLKVPMQEGDGSHANYDKSNTGSNFGSYGYEQVYRHLLERDKERMLLDDARYRIALDSMSETLFWLDWMAGVIVAEQLVITDTSESSRSLRANYLGVVADFRQSSRRPLELVVDSVASTLIWLSGELDVGGSSGGGGLWRDYWLEMSDEDGSRRSILCSTGSVLLNSKERKSPGRPRHLLLEQGSTGHVFWTVAIPNSNMEHVVSFQVSWKRYRIRVGHIMGSELNVTANRIFWTETGSVGPMTLLNHHLYLVISSGKHDTILSVSDVGKITGNSFQTLSPTVFRWSYLSKQKSQIVKLLPLESRSLHRISVMGQAERLHPCSKSSRTEITGRSIEQPHCSHLCISTLPIDLASGGHRVLSGTNRNNGDIVNIRNGDSSSYSIVAVLQPTGRSGGKYRCACPLGLVLSYHHRQRQADSNIIQSTESCVAPRFLNPPCQHSKNRQQEFICRAGRFFSRGSVLRGHCLPAILQCDGQEDCLDGSDESPCRNSKSEAAAGGVNKASLLISGCNETHPYRCSNSVNGHTVFICLSLFQRCDGVRHCDSDEHCCGGAHFECLSVNSGNSNNKRCLPNYQRCDGIRNCDDGSDEYGCFNNKDTNSGDSVNEVPTKWDYYKYRGDYNKGYRRQEMFNKLNNKFPVRASIEDNDNLNGNGKNSLPHPDKSHNVVAIVCGCIAGFVCLIAIGYIAVSKFQQKEEWKPQKRRRQEWRKKWQTAVEYQPPTSSPSSVHHHFHHHHHHHEASLFRTDNLNMIMLVPSPPPPPHPSSYSESDNNDGNVNNSNPDIHFNSIVNLKKVTSTTTNSVSSLSECYRRIREPHNQMIPTATETIIPPISPPRSDYHNLHQPPLFSTKDDILFLQYQNYRCPNRQKSNFNKSKFNLSHLMAPASIASHSSTSTEKLNNPPPSLVTCEDCVIADEDCGTSLPAAPRNSTVSSSDEEHNMKTEKHINDMNDSKFSSIYPSDVLQNILQNVSSTNGNNNSQTIPTSLQHKHSRSNRYKRRRRNRRLRSASTTNTNNHVKTLLHVQYTPPPPPSPNTVISM